jgi:hypothetical protein
LDISANEPSVHFDAIIAKGPSFCHPLQDFRAGDAEPDEIAPMSDAAVIHLATILF